MTLPTPTLVIPGSAVSSKGSFTSGAQVQLDTSALTGTLSGLAASASVQAMAAVVDGFQLSGGTPGMVSAAMVSYDNANALGIFGDASVDTVREALDLVDGTGIGSQPVTFTGSFFCAWGLNGNQSIWYGGRQSLMLVGARGQTNGRRTFEVPDPTELGLAFDDLASRGLAEVLTRTIAYQGGSSTSIVRNSLTIRAPSVSVGFPRGTFPTTLAQGSSATFRIERIGGVIQPWERVSVQQTADPVATIGEVVLQNVGWNNADISSLPGAGQVLKGYAFPVVGSNPNDGTLRQGLLDSGVSDRVIYDGDYVVWTADTFTSWVDGDNWFVWERNGIQRISQEASNFLSQVSEIDNRVDVAPVQMLTGDALVWISENPLAAAPFLTPSADSSNPRSGDDYAYIGGREDRNFMQQFQFGQNRFNSYLTVGITPGFITGHPESDIRVRIYDTDRNLIDDFNLATDFTFRNDSDFTNGTVRHYTRSTTVNYPFLATIEIWLTQVAEHFRMNPDTVDVTQNVRDLPESQLSSDVQEKLNRAIPPQGVTYDSIQDRLSPYASVTTRSPAVDARFYSDDGAGAYPSDLSDFTQVPANNPVFEASGVVLFVAVPEPGNFILQNRTASTDTALDQASPNIEVVESLTVSGVTYFVYRVTSVTSGDRFEVIRTQSHQVVAWANSISNLLDDVQRIDAELEHAALNLPDAVVHFLEDLTVTEESTPTINPTTYNRQLAGTGNATQTVFYEPAPVAPSGGLKASQPLSALSGDQVRRKLLMVPPSQPANQESYITAFDGSTGRDLISYINGEYLVNVRVPAQAASTVTSTVYPAPATRVSGPGIWQSVEALTFVNGVPVPEADELFFTRNIPTSGTVLTIDYRGHANGNIFGTAQTTLAGVGGGSDAITSFTLNDGSEQAFVEVRYTASTRQIRVSVTERVNTGLPTINDIEVILSFDETRTIPATPGTTRQVAVEHVNDGWQVFAFKPGATGNLVVVGDQVEIDTNRTYETWFGASLGGHISIADEAATFLNFEDFEPVASTVQNLEDHATLPQFGLFATAYTHQTLVSTGVQLRADNSQGDPVNIGEELVLVAPDNTRWRLSVDATGNLTTAQVT